MFNIGDFLDKCDLPKTAQIQHHITAVVLSVILVLALLATAIELTLADASTSPEDARELVIDNTAIGLTQAIINTLRFEQQQDQTEAPVAEFNPDLEQFYDNADSYVIEESYVSEAADEEHIQTSEIPQRVMYLTFDDGPTRAVTPQILDILAERDIKATFFVVGRNVVANPDIMQRIVDEGHTVGIHSYTHDYSQIYASHEAFLRDFKSTQALIAEFTGYKSNIYRFPGGSVTRFNETVRRSAIDFFDDNGIVFFDWNASIDDSIGGNRTQEQLLARGLETISGDHVIMLAHDTQPNTALMMGDMIDILAEDFTFEVLTRYVEPIQMMRSR